MCSLKFCVLNCEFQPVYLLMGQKSQQIMTIIEKISYGKKKKKIRSPPNKEKDIFKILKLLQFLKYKNKKIYTII